MKTIIDLMEDPAFFAKTFRRRMFKGDTFFPWKVFIKALCALPMNAEELAFYRKHTGRTSPPSQPFRECFVIAGRRSGKSLIAALCAVFVACFVDHSESLAPGETGVVMVLSSDRSQARVLMGYINAFLEVPLLATMVTNRTKESIELNNRIRIEIRTSSYKTVRGFTVVAAILDELAFWPTDENSASPDIETLAALRPAMATIRRPLLLAISSPYAKRGSLYAAYRDHHGKDSSDVLVWKAASREMNSTLPARIVAAAYLSDQASWQNEYAGNFRDDISGFITREILESRVVPRRSESYFNPAHDYMGFCDPSGGVSDSFTLAIAHLSPNGETVVLDCVREIEAPFSPTSTVEELSVILKRYGLSAVTGDKYAGEWPREAFQKCGISYQLAEHSRSDLYLELLPALMSGRVELLDHKKMISQFADLERRTGRTGKDSVDHPPNGHDDIANAVAGALVRVLQNSGGFGLIEFYASGRAQRFLENLDSPSKPAATFKPEVFDACPRCGSTCRVRIGGAGLHCNSCSFDVVSGVLVQEPPNRRDVLSDCIKAANATFRGRV